MNSNRKEIGDGSIFPNRESRTVPNNRALIIFLGIVLILNLINIFEVFATNSDHKQDIASGVVPHHLLAEDIMEDFFSYIAQQEYPETIIILSPDHFHSTVLNEESSFITVALESDNKKFNQIKVDFHLLKELAAKNKISLNNSAVTLEFGITNLLPFIRKYFPMVKILPLLIPADISREQVAQLVDNIDKIASSRTILIASVDFSHYLPVQAATFHDTRSIRVLLNCEEENFENIEVDSWQSLYAVRLFAKLRQKETPHIIAHQNSAYLLKLDGEETTSYFSVIFEDDKPKKYSPDMRANHFNLNKEVETILLVGDVMLDRGVEKFIHQNSVYYPFQKIVQFLRGVDMVFGNLEGPIIENPPEFAEHSLQFASYPEVLQGVRWSKMNLFSLANNHTLDMGKDGLEETMDWLEKYQIHYIGNPLSSYSMMLNPSFSTDHTVFLAFNQVLPFLNHTEEIIKKVEVARAVNPEKYLVVGMHWGLEYQLTSSFAQQELAYQIIEAGADFIVGHHPHVVQDIERYQGKLIFYSLGNFIFDQGFSEDTQEGLAVGLAVYPDRIICRLFPLQIHLCQPRLMGQGKAKEFLKKLAHRSDQKIFNEIYSGIIELKRSKNRNEGK